MMRRLVACWVLSFAMLAGCASNNQSRRDSGPMDGGERDGGGDCEQDDDCLDDGIFCNGGLACVEGRCVASEVPTCNDGIACTRDECIGATDECQNTPIDTACPPGNVCILGSGCGTAPTCEFDGDCTGDGMFCNGDEVCVGGMCMSPAAGRDCADTNSCTADECVEATRNCASTPYPDVLTNPMHCGTGADDCVVCPEPDPALHQVAVCTAGACGLACMTGFADRNGDPADGCEYGCTIIPGVDAPDDAFTDGNCDGIDGDRALAIFVSTSGSDANDGLTPSTAVASLRRAFEIFAATPVRVQILVATGSYSSSTMLELPNGVGVYGGYSTNFLMRADTRASIVASTPTALRARNLTLPTTIDRVSFTTADRIAGSEAAVAVVVENSGANLTLRFLSVTAGRGGVGDPGGTGTTGSTGGVGAAMPNNQTSGGSGGSPGGGAGASGVYRGEGVRGSDGNLVGTGCGHGGIAPVSTGRGCLDGDPAPPGPNGEPGCGGSRGGHGAGGDGLGTFSGSTWSPSSGRSGDPGTPGGGGGGGASGSGENCTEPFGGGCIYCDTGRAGGGGGGGGAGGTGGVGGQSGGASVGIRLMGSTLNAQQLRVQTAGGGNGGTGGTGGPGGPGGLGQAGAISTQNTAASGGAGGQGGQGGEGGCGGGGGGGPSIAIWGDGTSARIRELSPITFATGAGGTGGSSCGNAGSPGTSTNVRDAFFD